MDLGQLSSFSWKDQHVRIAEAELRRLQSIDWSHQSTDVRKLRHKIFLVQLERSINVNQTTVIKFQSTNAHEIAHRKFLAQLKHLTYVIGWLLSCPNRLMSIGLFTESFKLDWSIWLMWSINCYQIPVD